MPKRPVTFSIEHRAKDSLARAGVIHTPHGDIQTPAFTAVGTKATVKGMEPQVLAQLGVQILIANTYHLYLSPGEEVVEKGGGVGKFMGWNGPAMTDSGGFQVFSLGAGFGKKISKFMPEMAAPERGTTLFDEDLATSHGKLAIIDDEGVSFTSHLDGSLHRFTPERSIEIQHRLGADIIFAFDECTAPTATYAQQKEAMERTHSWAKRSLAAHRQNVAMDTRQGIYGVGQGGQFDDLRRESARTIGNMGFDGFGLGGSFSKKYGDDSLQSALDILSELPSDMPIHGLGVGEPEDLFLAASYGVDTFDCVLPTRNGRAGTLYTAQGKINIGTAMFREDFSPIDPKCECPVCRDHTRAYVHHLFKTHEMLGPILATMHNLFFLADLVRRIRVSIIDGNFAKLRDDFLGTYRA